LPAVAFESIYNNNLAASLYEGLVSGVPEKLRGLKLLYKNCAKLRWKIVVAPAVNVSRHGFQVMADTVRYTDSAGNGFIPKGTRMSLGNIITRKRYARTLETIGEYGGNIANTAL
jgi:gamma-glutamyltranspeptidase / glutathione hydrolase